MQSAGLSIIGHMTAAPVWAGRKGLLSTVLLMGCL